MIFLEVLCCFSCVVWTWSVRDRLLIVLLFKMSLGLSVCRLMILNKGMPQVPMNWDDTSAIDKLSQLRIRRCWVCDFLVSLSLLPRETRGFNWQALKSEGRSICGSETYCISRISRQTH